jgi:hypothetical protein
MREEKRTESIPFNIFSILPRYAQDIEFWRNHRRARSLANQEFLARLLKRRVLWERYEMGRLKSSRKCSAAAVLWYPGFLLPAESLAEWKETSSGLNRAYSILYC